VPEAKRQQGGLSGQPLKARALEVLQFVTARTKLPVIGVGGLRVRDDALERLNAGAALIQVYTGLIFERGRVWWARFTRALFGAGEWRNGRLSVGRGRPVCRGRVAGETRSMEGVSAGDTSRELEGEM